MAIVRFNRKFTQAQLTAAVGTSHIAETAVVDGTWYIAKTGAAALYVGSIESGGTATLKLVAEVNGASLDGHQITDLINTYIASTQSPTLITKVDSAVKDGSGNTITSTYLDKTTNNAQNVAGPVTFGNGVTVTGDATITSGSLYTNNIYPEDSETTSVTINGGLDIEGDTNLNGNSIIGETGDTIISDGTADGGVTIGTPNLVVQLSSSTEIVHYDGDNTYKILDTGAQTLTDAEKTQVRTNIGATSSSDVDTKINALDGTITKTAGSASASTAANAYQKVPVVSGFVLKEVDGKLVETNAASNPSTVTTVDVDVAGSAQKALNDAKNYADTLIADLGSIMTYQGTYPTEAALKSGATTPHKGDVYVVTADSSEWVYSGDTVDATHPYDSTKWEKFGTTDVQGALYKGDNVFTNETLVIADGTAGKMKAVTDADVATRLADETAFTGKYKVLQTAVQDTAVAGKYISEIDQDTQGVITITRTDLPSGSGSVGTASSDASAWKTVVHDVSLSGHTLSGNTKSIPAATSSNDGYMTTTQATDVTKSVAKVDGISHGISNHEINSYCECSTAAGTVAKTASLVSGDISGFAAGLRVAVKFTNANTANNPTLDISSTSPIPGSTGAKNIYVNGTQITTGSNKGLLRGVCIFIYDGTQWHLIGGGSDYTAGDGLTLTDHKFAVKLQTNGGLLIDDETKEIYVGVDTESYNEDSTTDAWKRPVIVDSSEDGPCLTHSSDYLLISGNYANIPQATTSNDGYMSAAHVTNLAIAIGALQWEE